MKRIVDFFKESNRYKHLIGGALVGLLAMNVWTAIYAVVVAASCLELKDKLYGGSWDWIDWAVTLLGGAIPAIVWWLIGNNIIVNL